MLKTMFFLLTAFQLTTFSQESYFMELTNPIQINSKTLEFDIKIESTDTDFTLSSYQCSFSFDLNVSQNDSICLNYIENTSELENFPINIVGYDTTDGMNELIFVSGIGNDLITVEEKSIGKFSICATVDFSLEDLNLMWNFSGSANTILTGTNFYDITEPANHINFDNSITDIYNSVVIPDRFELSQNYPNPFNPTTKINFNLPEKGIVKLTIYNTLGEKVLDVLNDSFEAGLHTVEINGSQLPSGVFVYKLNVEDKYLAVKKMMLLK